MTSKSKEETLLPCRATVKTMVMMVRRSKPKHLKRRRPALALPPIPMIDKLEAPGTVREPLQPK